MEIATQEDSRVETDVENDTPSRRNGASSDYAIGVGLWGYSNVTASSVGSCRLLRETCLKRARGRMLSLVFGRFQYWFARLCRRGTGPHEIVPVRATLGVEHARHGCL